MLLFAELSLRNEGTKFSQFDVFIDACTLSPLNSVSSRYFLNHVDEYICLMSFNTSRQIMLNETSSQLQSTSQRIKSYTSVTSQTHGTIFQ